MFIHFIIFFFISVQNKEKEGKTFDLMTSDIFSMISMLNIFKACLKNVEKRVREKERNNNFKTV